MTALAAARQHLLERYRAADAAGDCDERAVLDPLADVADYVCRIGDRRTSAHYAADKAGSLLQAAIRLQQETLAAYADRDHRGPGPLDSDEPWDAPPDIDALVDLFGALREVTSAVASIGWGIARDDLLRVEREEGSSSPSTDRLADIDRATHKLCAVARRAVEAQAHAAPAVVS